MDEPVPYISEFHVRRVDGMLEATRAGDLSDYQIAHGCEPVIRAATEGELQMLAMTERVKADLVKAAERAAGVAEAPRGRDRDLSRSPCRADTHTEEA